MQSDCVWKVNSYPLPASITLLICILGPKRKNKVFIIMCQQQYEDRNKAKVRRNSFKRIWWKLCFAVKVWRRWDCWLPEASRAWLHVPVGSATAISHTDGDENTLFHGIQRRHIMHDFILTRAFLKLHSRAITHILGFARILSCLRGAAHNDIIFYFSGNCFALTNNLVHFEHHHYNQLR